MTFLSFIIKVNYSFEKNLKTIVDCRVEHYWWDLFKGEGGLIRVIKGLQLLSD